MRSRISGVIGQVGNIRFRGQLRWLRSHSVLQTQKKMFVDDKSEICIPFIINALKQHQQTGDSTFFIGLNGLQGVGKTTLVNYRTGHFYANSQVTNLDATLRQPPYSLPVVVLSIDDLYLTHADQVALAAAHPSNPLIQHRGEPGTHDIPFAAELFSALKDGKPALIPRYDKSQFSGQGDRADKSTWIKVNEQEKVKVVIFEGWCVGFRALSDDEVVAKYNESVATKSATSTLWKYKLEDLLFVNDQLRKYDVMTDTFNAMIHIDAEDTRYVYKWRLQQEAELRDRTGRGMTDEQVVHFVDGYYPAYELFTQKLRDGVVKQPGRQLRLVVGDDRKVKQTFVI